MANRIMHVVAAALALAFALLSSCTSNSAGGAAGAGGIGGASGAAAGSGSAGLSASGAGGAAAGAGGSAAAGGGGADHDAGSDSGSGDNTDAGVDAGATLPGWTLSFSDEFDGAAGSAVDSTKWNMVDKGDGFGNNELQFYRSGTSNAALDGQGSLLITAKKESYMGRDYTSAKLETSGKLEQQYGRFEARMKLPRGQGIWPAFWMLGNDIGSVGWPTCGEIDILENIGKEPKTVHGTLHGPGYSGGNPVGFAYMLPSGADFADAFHVFAVEWEENVVRFYVDGELYVTRTPDDLPDNTEWVYDHPFYLILNLAVGGQWPGPPDQTTVFPQTLAIDYVRVYER